jgi:transcriptional regulator with XRE-family HTH domain
MTGAEIKALRVLNKMTQAEFGVALGYSRIAVNTWENDRFQPPKDLLAQMAAKHMLVRKLNTTHAYMMYDIQRRELRKSHVEGLQFVAEAIKIGDLQPFTDDDKLMIAHKYPDIFAKPEL